MDTVKYRAEIMTQLSDTAVYKKITCDPTAGFQRELQLLIDDSLNNGLIDQKLSEFLFVNSPITPVLYTLPKIHKDLLNPPGRPIVSGRGSMCNKVSIFLDKILRVFSTSAGSYIRDTNDFLEKLNTISVCASTFLVSFDVVSLYTSIEHERGLDAVCVALSGSDVSPDCAQLVLRLLEFILRRNFFLFGDDYYQQLRGTAMGSNVAPTYANIYMALPSIRQRLQFDLHAATVHGALRQSCAALSDKAAHEGLFPAETE
ncbi:unnamed protein product [Ranitomeya imitator]|uniref:Reverse transcriptase domain-containing protein n=1 Tax=Ranitomeya imitator TaxID=111125 RepID=A0ABN9LYK9_9NEOB|nr:unnamed protein product [Ranitomeya imitator]